MKPITASTSETLLKLSSSLSALVAIFLAGSFAITGCSSSSDADPPDNPGQTDDDAGSDADNPDADEPEDPCAIADCEYPPLSLWQEPLLDYIEATKGKLSQSRLRKSIADFIVFDERLYFGYGDADLNAGRVTDIQVRYFEAPEDTSYSAEDVKTDEEEIAVFRKFGNKLYIPGVDATEDAWLGNVLSKPSGGKFTKHRTVTGGVHVHDIAEFQGNLYACGSGAPGPEEWNTGQVRSYLWKSEDAAESFEAVAQIENIEVGDRRYVHMIPFPDELLVFGYRTNPEYSIVELLSDSWDGETLSQANKVPGRFIEQTELFDEETAIIKGVWAASSPLKWETLVLRAGEDEAETIEGLEGKTVLDVMILEPGKAIFVVIEGDEYPLPKQIPPFEILYTENLVSFTKLAEGEAPAAWPTAVAHWKGGIYLGLANGQIWRSLAP